MKNLQKNLEAMGYTVRIFQNKEDAAAYLDECIDGKTVGMGGSVTLAEMGLFDRLKTHNEVFWHMPITDPALAKQTRKSASCAQVYLTSVNGISKKGEIVNIDNTGNRVAAATFGCEQVFFVIGQNKICDDLETAIHRARNIAAPLNAQRLGFATPCAKNAEKCFDCDSPQRICRNLSVFWKKPTGCAYEILLIEEKLGF